LTGFSAAPSKPRAAEYDIHGLIYEGANCNRYPYHPLWYVDFETRAAIDKVARRGLGRVFDAERCAW
jgi:hypothetical protein